MTNPFNDLSTALDEESWDWLNENAPAIANAVQTAITRKATPTDVRRFVVSRTGRAELAARCEQAARHLVSRG